MAGLVLLPLALRSLRIKLTLRDCLFFVSMGLLCVVLSMVSLQVALVFVPASTTAVLVCCNPAPTAVFARIFLGERIYPSTVLTIILCITGILFIIDPYDIDLSPVGAALILFSAATFSMYTVVSRKRADRYPMIVICCFGFLFGSAQMLLLIGAGNIPFVAEQLTSLGLEQFTGIGLLDGISPENLPILLYAGAGVTGVGYMMYFLAMMEKSAAFASIAFLVKPVLATLFAVWILNEAISANMAAGIVLILAGSALLLWKNLRMGKKNAAGRPMPAGSDSMDDNAG